MSLSHRRMHVPSVGKGRTFAVDGLDTSSRGVRRFVAMVWDSCGPGRFRPHVLFPVLFAACMTSAPVGTIDPQDEWMGEFAWVRGCLPKGAQAKLDFADLHWRIAAPGDHFVWRGQDVGAVYFFRSRTVLLSADAAKSGMWASLVRRHEMLHAMLGSERHDEVFARCEARYMRELWVPLGYETGVRW